MLIFRNTRTINLAQGDFGMVAAFLALAMLERLGAGLVTTLALVVVAIVLAGQHADIMKKARWSREDVQRYCFEHSRSTVAELKRANMMAGELTAEDERNLYPLVESPQDFLVIPAGGRVGDKSAYIPGWGSKKGSQSVTKEIRKP